jgi:hypothetical protein
MVAHGLRSGRRAATEHTARGTATLQLSAPTDARRASGDGLYWAFGRAVCFTQAPTPLLVSSEF